MVPGPIIIVEDDRDDRFIIAEVLKELNIPNKTLWFSKCMEAFDYLKSNDDQPFIIICDINLPEVNGIEFKRQVDSDPELRRKSIPFVFSAPLPIKGILTKFILK
jgi:CheY-like chemotaxis protein